DVAGDVLLTNPWGDWIFVTQAQFADLARGKLDPRSELHARLADKSFIRSKIDAEKVAAALRRKKRFLDYGPNLHLMVVTLRCNETCVYCHASRANMDAVHTDMTPEIAEKCVDLALQSTSPALTIEFQGGEPLVAFDIIKHIVTYALQRNRAYGKELGFTMVSNLALMD